MPLSLNDAEFAAVQAAAAPIHPRQRDAFLKALAEELERHPVVDPDLMHRLAGELRRRYVISPERGSAAPTYRADGWRPRYGADKSAARCGFAGALASKAARA